MLQFDKGGGFSKENSQSFCLVGCALPFRDDRDIMDGASGTSLRENTHVRLEFLTRIDYVANYMLE